MKVNNLTDGEYKYIGSLIDNLPHGEGTEIFPNKDTFKGIFVHGQRSGFGKYQWNSGVFKSYQGLFKQDIMHGQGILLLRKGETISGEFQCERSFKIQVTNLQSNGYMYSGVIDNGEFRNTFILQKDHKKYQLFEDKKLIEINKKADTDEIRLILTQVQRAYEKALKHSEALKSIQSRLQKYECRWLKENIKDAMVIIPICGRQIAISRKKQVKL